MAKGLFAVFALEAVAPLILVRLPLSAMAGLGLLRCLQTLLLLILVQRSAEGWGVVGLDRRRWPAGLRWGLTGAAAFAAAALAGGSALYLLGINPLALLRTPLPAAAHERLLFFVVGGLVAPVAEEILFRGFLYTFCRRWGILTALALSTALFVAMHLPRGLPLTQIVGGLVFALAYEYSGSLIAAILIHGLGNLAIFSLSLL